MSTAQAPVSDMLITVKAREVQRAMLAEMRGDREDANRHFLAAAHLELVLANDYEQAGEADLAFRSRLSAASSFWRGGQVVPARQLFESLLQSTPARAAEIQQLIADLQQGPPA